MPQIYFPSYGNGQVGTNGQSFDQVLRGVAGQRQNFASRLQDDSWQLQQQTQQDPAITQSSQDLVDDAQQIVGSTTVPVELQRQLTREVGRLSRGQDPIQTQMTAQQIDQTLNQIAGGSLDSTTADAVQQAQSDDSDLDDTAASDSATNLDSQVNQQSQQTDALPVDDTNQDAVQSLQQIEDGLSDAVSGATDASPAVQARLQELADRIDQVTSGQVPLSQAADGIAASLQSLSRTVQQNGDADGIGDSLGTMWSGLQGLQQAAGEGQQILPQSVTQFQDSAAA